MELLLPSETFFDLMVVLSFYNSCPGCKIGFDGPDEMARIITDADPVMSAYQYLKEMEKQVFEGHLFGLFWDNKQYDLQHFDKSCAQDGSPRCCAHEYKVIEKKKPKKKPKIKYGSSPLVMEFRNDNNHHKCKVVMEYQNDKCKIMPSFVTFNNVLFSLCRHEVPLLGNEIVAAMKQIKMQNPRAALAMGWDARMIPNNANVINELSPWLPIRSLLAMSALSLFPTYISQKRIVVDGCRYYGSDLRLFIPLCKPIDLQQFRLVHRHPKLHEFQFQKNLWRTIGLIAMRQFQLCRQGKSDWYLDRVDTIHKKEVK